MNSEPNNEDVRCPKCKSAKIHAEKRGYSIWVGFIGSGQIVVTCLACGHKFKPGQGLAAEPVKTPEPPAPSKLMQIEEDERGIPTYKLD